MENSSLNYQRTATDIKIKFLLISFLSVFFWTTSSGQVITSYNKFSVEASGGFHIPVTPLDGINTSDYIGFKQFQAGARYMINSKFGLKAFFATNRFDGGESGPNPFDDGKEIDYHNTFTRIGIEGVVNLGDLFKMGPRYLEKNGILFHGGAGLTYSAPATVPGKTDRMGILVFGLTPQRKLSDKFAIFVDATYVVNLKQHYAYNGVPLNANMDAVVGGFLSLNFGLTYYLGGNKDHADWYWGN